MRRRQLLAGAAATALAGCAAPFIVADRERDPLEGGIGGTGIVGLLTDFGSVIVGGLRVELDRGTRIVSAFGSTDEDALAIGTPLSVEARRDRGALVAARIFLTQPLIGAVSAGADSVPRVNGVAMQIEPGALGTAAPGTRVSVSGIWDGETVIASRIDAAPDPRDVIAGVVRRDAAGQLSIGGTMLQIGANQPRPLPGRFATAIGRFADGVLTTERVTLGRFAGSAGDLRQLAVEGYLEPVTADPGFRIAGLGHSFDEQVQLAPLARERAVYYGPYDGEFRAAQALILPQRFDTRRTLLRTRLTDPTASEVVGLRP
ncbi:DUF5666 domain-containing protein [Pontivivens ytuae]|uniref:DUF5666 domain-containing protein n=1 Tax=Pontivivens ytuae TaxID=2789856 RepID=A0A7S9QCG2_9RHOB|nr:DUF5666 domain-containing protein [Pontivivens ytuae]QPH54183.1 hypothetical protein I0K15_20840 [Pontivivens ytuae]